MKFCYLGKKVLLQGLHPTSPSFLEADKFFTGSLKKDLVIQITNTNSVAVVQS